MEISMEMYRENLLDNEMKETTVKKYIRDLQRFLRFLQAEQIETVNKKSLILYKQELEKSYRPASINSYLLSINRYMRWAGAPENTVKIERIQKQCSLQYVLERAEYEKLLNYAAAKRKWKYYCIMRTLACTGIRIGELQYITCGALEKQVAVVNNKGKIREICIADPIRDLLIEYCGKNHIFEGIIFRGRRDENPLDTTGIWRALKRIAAGAGVLEEKVFPHSFRHLFARTYMRQVGNIAELSDILGHSNIETTRIYTMETLKEKRDSLSKLAL